MGFTDDIVVRVAEAGSGSHIDVRSASRHGRSDLGVNAARIRTYLRLLTRRRNRQLNCNQLIPAEERHGSNMPYFDPEGGFW